MTSPCPISYMARNLAIGPRFHAFLANFLLCMRRNGQNSTSAQIFNPKFETPMGCFQFEYELLWGFRQDLYMFWAKNSFCNAKFLEFGGWWGWGWPFWRNPQKAHPWLISCVFSHYASDPFARFFARRLDEKRDTTKSHREVIFHLFAGNSPLNQIQLKLVCQ